MDDDQLLPEQMDWQSLVNALSQLRESADYSPPNVEMIRQSLQSEDERVRAAGALTAAGCVFEAFILDLLMELAEYDPVTGVRKAAIQSLEEVILEGVAQDLEDDAGADNAMDYAEEWEEYQTGGLRDDYQRVKALLFGMLDYEESPDIVEKVVNSLSDLGYMAELRDHIAALYDSDLVIARITALRAMGKYPEFWEREIAAAIAPDSPDAMLKEALSAGYASGSVIVSDAIETILNHEEAEILRYALLSLANINQSPHLIDILQHFSVHPESTVQETAREGLNLLSRLNLGDYLRDNLGYSE